MIEEKLSNTLLLLPWIKGHEIIMTAGKSEGTISNVRAEVFLQTIPYASKAGPRRPKDPRSVALGPPFDGCDEAGTLASCRLRVALELGSV